MDRNECAGALLIDLSKAFDCLPHDFLLAMLNAYDLSNDATSLLKNYLGNRGQQVKLGSNLIEFLTMVKGVT